MFLLSYPLFDTKQDANCEENTAIDGNIFTDPLIYCPRGDNTRNKGGKCGEGNGSALRAGGKWRLQV